MIEILPDSGHQEVEVGGPRGIPSSLPVLPLRETVPLPDTLMPLAVGQERSVQLVNDVLAGNRMLVMVASRDPDDETPGPEQLYDVGVVGSVARMLKVPDGTLRILVQGAQRVHLDSWDQEEPYLVASLTERPDVVLESPELVALQRNVLRTFSQIVEEVPYLPEELQLAVANVEDPSALSYLIAGSLRLKTEEKQELLEEPDVAARLRKLVEALARELEVVSIGSKIQSQVQSEIDKGQREYVLRQQLKAIQDELGETTESAEEAAQLREQLHAMALPADVRKQADRELGRLEHLPPAAAEHGVIRTYLEWLSELPWKLADTPPIDVAAARRILDNEHFGLEKVKRRIVEFLAVRKLNPGGKGPILCFVGPPGVGKTSLGQSIAHATGQPFVRVSLGGVHDESEIRGHRRTYIGALPGNIVQALRRAGSRSCVMMLDEIDKLGAGGFQGDPASAMLEVLDPEQNSTFRDAYLGVPFDLSRVLFIATANQLDTIPGPLRDRMEVVQLSGYTAEEKLAIARSYLVPRQMTANGLAEEQAELPDEALSLIISGYTREAGVRNLEREIGAVFRSAAVRVAEGAEGPIRIGPEDLPGILGPSRFDAEVAGRVAVPGVATGLAWTPVGGDILFIESTRMAGSGKLILTGQLGEVMRESAQAALSLVKSRAGQMGLPADAFGGDIHVHVPAGAIPKDGPSAGVAMFMSLASLMLGRAVDPAVAMTGEISLRGLVLPVGGIREKVVAAARAGITTVMLPARNRRDWDDIPPSARDALHFVWLDTVDDAVAAALAGVEEPA